MMKGECLSNPRMVYIAVFEFSGSLSAFVPSIVGFDLIRTRRNLSSTRYHNRHSHGASNNFLKRARHAYHPVSINRPEMTNMAGTTANSIYLVAGCSSSVYLFLDLLKLMFLGNGLRTFTLLRAYLIFLRSDFGVGYTDPLGALGWAMNIVDWPLGELHDGHEFLPILEVRGRTRSRSRSISKPQNRVVISGY